MTQIEPYATKLDAPSWALLLIRWPHKYIYENHGRTPVSIPILGTLPPNRRFCVMDSDLEIHERKTILTYVKANITNESIRFRTQAYKPILYAIVLLTIASLILIIKQWARLIKCVTR